MKQLWSWYHGARKLLTNPLKVVRLNYQQAQFRKLKPHIPMEGFVKAAGCITDQQPKTLLYYHHCMGVKQNDPKGDHWEVRVLYRPLPFVLRSDFQRSWRIFVSCLLLLEQT